MIKDKRSRKNTKQTHSDYVWRDLIGLRHSDQSVEYSDLYIPYIRNCISMIQDLSQNTEQMQFLSENFSKLFDSFENIGQVCRGLPYESIFSYDPLFKIGFFQHNEFFNRDSDKWCLNETNTDDLKIIFLKFHVLVQRNIPLNIETPKQVFKLVSFIINADEKNQKIVVKIDKKDPQKVQIIQNTGSTVMIKNGWFKSFIRKSYLVMCALYELDGESTS